MVDSSVDRPNTRHLCSYHMNQQPSCYLRIQAHDTEHDLHLELLERGKPLVGFDAEFTEIGNSTDFMTDPIEIGRKEFSTTSPGSAQGRMVLWITPRSVI
ncbi:uncharacterized protein UDID_17389 [Ustilago sp. UG-2017a]|nr:uncharacterized protein UDID_17389 [Ustilago sp. UG-2017a]